MNDEARQARAARRRATYEGEVVAATTPKPALYAGATPLERLGYMTSLCRAQWLASGRSLPRLPRGEWPGEIIESGRD